MDPVFLAGSFLPAMSCSINDPARNPSQTFQTMAVAEVMATAASLKSWALAVFSQVNSGSERPKWPPLAVLR
jgi:hypothetical protein